jgi:hypothetical protein
VSKSGSTNVTVGLKHYNGGKLYSSHLEEEWMLLYVNRHPPIGNEDRSYMWYKR